MERKQLTAEVKATPQDGPGTFTAYVSIFGNVDSVGDRMVKGAFARTLKERGLPPIIWSHRWELPPIGKTLTATEDDTGLLIKGSLFIDDNDVARQVYVAMKEGALREFSFAFDIVSASYVEEDGATVREVKDVELYEVGPTLVGANSETELVGIKSSETAVADPEVAEEPEVTPEPALDQTAPQDDEVEADAYPESWVEVLLEARRH